ncbi:MAG TPA: zinc ribbon domain-containing protein [Deltaproteobacteria bacterium]|jgi:hypothetical protein|nr:zinc ribbon domain-containing protein [Deltaproteobacteria bacterium]HOI07309.1 zinc ribbon domain-containing protein [Deltaproteobacteria bacterium]
MDANLEQGREMARIVTQPFKDTEGREAALPVIGRIFLVAGILAALSGVVATILTASFLWLVSGIGCLVLGAAFFVLFGALAEVIILLKRIAGLPYKGAISGMTEGTISVCSDCGSLVYPDNVKCPHCSADFEPPAGGSRG